MSNWEGEDTPEGVEDARESRASQDRTCWTGKLRIYSVGSRYHAMIDEDAVGWEDLVRVVVNCKECVE
jgi:hypothetical protein